MARSKLSSKAMMIGLALFAQAAALPAARAATAVGHVSVTIVPALAMVEEQPMSFGVVGVTKAGGRVVLAASGAMSGPSAFVLSGPAKPGEFVVTGAPNAPVTVSFSSGDAVTGPGPAMPLSGFTHSGGPAPVLGPTGQLKIAVGAAIDVAPAQPYGSYAGTYTVLVNY